MIRKLGINTDCLCGEDEKITLKLVYDHGFQSITTSKTSVFEVAELKNTAESLGVEFKYLHAPFKGINSMWLPGNDYLSSYNAMAEAIYSASEAGVEAVIIHVSSGWNPPNVNDLGFGRFDSLVELAIKKNVVIAFENLRRIGHLTSLMDRYEDINNVRYCFDCGHEHCYTKVVSWLDIFTNKLIATHIHDNLGRPLYDKSVENDTHWLPFDGNYDYRAMMEKINKYEYCGPLMLEVFNSSRPEYMKLSSDQFLTTCYDRILQISKL